MNCITKSLALAVTSTVFVSCNKEPEATVKTHYGIDAPISQAQQINGVWVFNENAQKYQDEMESKYKKEFRDYVEIAYSSWCYKQELARPKENLGRLTNTEIATKYPMPREYFKEKVSIHKYWNPIMLDWFDQLDQAEEIANLK